MNREEAIKVLERAEGHIGIHYINGVDDPYINPCLMKSIDFAISALREQEERRWSPVDESPKGKGCYIVAVNHWLDGNPVTREAYWNGCDWLSCDKKRELTPRVTHWMPLPEPPKEGAEG